MKASKCLHKECVGILVIKIIVLDFSGCTFKIHKIRCVCTYKIGFAISEEPFISILLGTIAADDGVLS